MEKNIIIDVMGGDYAPSEIINGVKAAEKETEGIRFTLVGDIDKCKPLLWDSSRIDLIDVKHNKTEEYKIRRNSITSIGKGIENLLNNKDSVFISAANTGKVVAESFMRLGRIKGVERPAIAIVVPGVKGPTILLDVGANADCRPAHLVHFAILGSVYAKILFNKKNPRIGLLNIGSEESKGSKLYTDTYKELSNIDQINFAGNIEPNTMILEDEADVVVCDGFAGNILLKSMEGISFFTLGAMKSMGIEPEKMYALQNKLDYQEYGGAMLLGVNGNVVITHGATKARGIKNAIRFASLLIENNILNKLSDEINYFNVRKSNANTEEG